MKYCALATSLLVTTAVASTGFASDDEKRPPPPRKGGGEVDPRYGNTSILIDSVVVPDTSGSCGADPVVARLVCLSDLMLASASDELLELMQYDYSVEEAQNWSNIPAGAFPNRPGALLGEFTADQLGLVKAIMMEATSATENDGFDELAQTLNTVSNRAQPS